MKNKKNLISEFPLVNRRVNEFKTSNFFSESAFQSKKSMDNGPKEKVPAVN